MSRLKEIHKQVPIGLRQEIEQSMSTAYQNAIAYMRKKKHLSPSDIYYHISPENMFKLGRKILKGQSIWEAYDLLAEETGRKSGETYYDVVIGVQHRESYQALDKGLEFCEKKRVEHGLDIAAGSGESTLVLAKYCQEVDALDVSPSLLNAAGRKLRRKNIKHRLYEMDIMRHTLEEGTYDIIVSNGLTAFLRQEEFYTFFEIVNGLLKPGGRYYQLTGVNPSPKEYHLHPMAELVGEVARAVNMFSYAVDHMNLGGTKMPDFDKYGFSHGGLKIEGGSVPMMLVQATKK